MMHVFPQLKTHYGNNGGNTKVSMVCFAYYNCDSKNALINCHILTTCIIETNVAIFNLMLTRVNKYLFT